jgi:hypothetical protein
MNVSLSCTSVVRHELSFGRADATAGKPGIGLRREAGRQTNSEVVEMLRPAASIASALQLWYGTASGGCRASIQRRAGRGQYTLPDR